jgi:hypothetical protein
MVALINFMDATIANAAAVSNDLDLRGGAICRIFVPSTFDGTAITFLGGQAQGPMSDLLDELSAELQISVVPGRSYLIPVEWTLGCARVQLRAGTRVLPVNQTGETIIGVSVRPFA